VKNLTRSLIGASALLCLSALVQPAYAQSSDLYDLRGRQNTNLNAGFHVKVPFGATRKDVASDQARFGLMLSFDRDTRDKNSFALKRTPSSRQASPLQPSPWLLLPPVLRGTTTMMTTTMMMISIMMMIRPHR